MADGFRELIPAAIAAGVTLLLETHDDWSSSAPVRAVVERVDHPNVAVLWDLQHPQRMMETPEQTFAALGHRAKHLHAHDASYDPRDRRLLSDASIGEGAIDHATPLRLLRESAFDGYLSVEVIHQEEDAHDAEAVLAQYSEWFYRQA